MSDSRLAIASGRASGASSLQVPYVSQFASPELARAIVFGECDARSDPRWRESGAADPEAYAFWCMRACGIACLQSAIGAFAPDAPRRTMMELIREGVEMGAYVVHDERGELVDIGWIYAPLLELGRRHGLNGVVLRELLIEEIGVRVAEGELVIASVSPAIGDPDERIVGRGGHLVLVHGVEMDGGGIGALVIHNPSGRVEGMRENAVIPRPRFEQAFARRGIALWESGGHRSGGEKTMMV